MENFDVLESLVRVSLAGNVDAIRHQILRMADRLEAEGHLREAKSLRAQTRRSERLQAVEPLKLSPSERSPARLRGQRLTPKTSLPVDKETVAPLCEVIFPAPYSQALILPEEALESFASLVREWQHEERLEEHGLSVSRTLLIYGPPGTGKTTLALSIAAKLALPVVMARLDGLISSLLGNTARNLGALFDFCNPHECVLILDEFDAVAKVRDDSNEVGEIKRVVNALLQNLDIRVTYGLTIAITNHEQLLDSAIWRRFEHQIRLSMPSKQIRHDIAMDLLRGRSDADEISRAISFWTEGRSGADVRTLALSFLKYLVLADSELPTPWKALRSAAGATGIVPDGLGQDSDADVARKLHLSESGILTNDLALFFGRDRRTITRWLSNLSGV